MNGQTLVKCVSGDCQELIYYLFWLHHSGYCTKHPEKWGKIQKGWKLPDNIYQHVGEIYEKRTLDSAGLNKNEN